MHVAAVVGLLLAGNAVNLAGLSVMAACCGLSVRQFASEGSVAVLHAGMRRRHFWSAFWISAGAVIINTLTPLVLLAWFPPAAVLGVFVANAVTNVPAVPFRFGLWWLRPGSIDWAI
jgi:hypothetical protein